MLALASYVVHNPAPAFIEIPELRLAVFAVGILCLMFGVCLMTPIDAPEGE